MGSEAVAVGLSITDGLLPKDVVRSVQDSMHGEAEQLAYRYKVLEYDYINR
jgi:hypothetical protein